MYTKELVVEHDVIAGYIYDRLRLDYRYAKPKDVSMAEAKASLATKLRKLKDHEVLCWPQALEDLAIGRDGHPPSAQEIYFAIKRVGYRSAEAASAISKVISEPNTSDEVDYEALWNNADDKQKFRFFIDHKFCDVPPYVRYWFVKYNHEHRGWTAHESNMMVSFWKTPFNAAHSGAMAKHQYEILDYFKERTND